MNVCWVIKMLQGARSSDDKRQIPRWKESVSRFDGRFNDFILFHLKLDKFYFTGVMN